MWNIEPGVTYLNHGSFGPTPEPVQRVQADWTKKLAEQPMRFLVLETEALLDKTCRRLGQFLGCRAGNLLLTDNSTFGMNFVAHSFPLNAGDEVLLTDHEYGAVRRTWNQKARETDARVVTQAVDPAQTSDELVEQLFAGVTHRTRLLVVSHVTSPTAIVLPVKAICQRARQLGIPVCIDGPHAVAMRALDLKEIGCDFYTASCHKWLSAPIGTGFLYVHSRWQPLMKNPIVSWGGSISGRDAHWKDEFRWLGTRDPAGMLSIPAAIQLLETHGLERFRSETHALAQYAREQIQSLTGLPALVDDTRDLYGSMIAMPVPQPPDWEPATHGRADPLMLQLRERYRIEAPVFGWDNQRLLRVSCHLYNTRDDIDRLVSALRQLL